jgi:hypothetical protein
VVKKTMSKQQPEIKPVKIGNRFVGPGHPVYIVAELSANHRQDYDEAVRLIHAAREAGADAVKLQTYTPDTMTIDCNSELFVTGKDRCGRIDPCTNYIKRPTCLGNGSLSCCD